MCNHPNIFEFVNCKKDRTKVTGANISVMLTDDFMKSVINDEDYILKFPCDTKIEFDDIETLKYNTLITVTGFNGDICYVKKIKAKELYNQIVENAWDNAEPGQMFIDKHWNYSPDGVYEQFKGITTNPCGEIFMGMYDACRLLAMNFYTFVSNPFTNKASINYDKLYEISYIQQRLADILIDLELDHIDRIINKINNDPEEEDTKRIELELWQNVRKTAKASRRTGCGFTALGDMLAALNLKYDSKEALSVVNDVMKIKFEAELDCTIDLAILREPFEGWNNQLEYSDDKDSITVGNNDFYKMLQIEFPNQYLRMYEYGRRNVSWSTVAPTGSVSILTQTTSGLEPLFMPYYFRKKKINSNDEKSRVDFVDKNGDKWQEFAVLHPKFKEWININFDNLGLSGFENIDELSKEELQKYFEKSPWYGSTANDINWIDRVKLQSVIQKYTTHSISSTINLPKTATKEEVSEIYLKSWEMGLKGVTIYRDGCRDGVLTNESVKNTDNDVFKYHSAIKRGPELKGEIHSVSVKGERFNIIVGLKNDLPYEVFGFRSDNKKHGYGLIIKEKKGQYSFKFDNGDIINVTQDMPDNYIMATRLLSYGLRHGGDVKFAVEQLNKLPGDITSFGKAISRTLKKYIPDGEKSTVQCNNCGSNNVIFQEGCQTCLDCGNSKCG